MKKEVPGDVVEELELLFIPLSNIFILGPDQTIDFIFYEGLSLLFENLGEKLEIIFALSVMRSTS